MSFWNRLFGSSQASKNKFLQAAKNGDLETATACLTQDSRLASIKSEAGLLRGRTPLHEAASGGHTGIVRLLLKYKVNVDAKEDSLQMTPLHCAAMNGHSETGQVLISNGAGVNASSYAGGTALHWAAGTGHKSVVELLLASGADVNAKAQSGMPLHAAVVKDFMGIAEVLLCNGADVNGTDEFGRTPLHAVTTGGHTTGTAELLLRHRAEVNAKDKFGKTPFHYANQNSYKDVGNLLRRHGGHE